MQAAGSHYVHGYDEREGTRLRDQAASLEALLHADTAFPAGSRVLEVGCGVGAQTVPLARRSPGAHFVAIDQSAASIATAAKRTIEVGLSNIEFIQADIFDLPFEPASFDHAFVCFVLEHLREPRDALQRIRKFVRPGGTITVIEGDHGTTCFHPKSTAGSAAIEALVALQGRGGGDATIGRMLYPLLTEAGFQSVQVLPRMVYVDGSRPALAESFTRLTFAAMIQGVREPALASGLIDSETFEAGVAALNRAAEPDGVFCYTFFKAIGTTLPA
jgi:ubiquinone/menaquinone biosynthesis C-methylase UbiE